jgi:quercetin dioxygenase-like cupin family protein
MAYKNKTITNSKNGMSIRFLQTAADTGGKLLEMQASYHPHSTEPPPHYHPYQDEVYTILQGEFSSRINGEVKVLKKGDTLSIPHNTIHSAWNHTGDVTVINWRVEPALNTEHFLETATGLANDHKTDEKGMPSFLQRVAMGNTFSDAFRLSSPPFMVLKTIFVLLGPVAGLLGYKGIYEKYID